MALPADVSTITLTFGPYLDAAGKPTCAGLSATITPDRRVTHAGDGTVILPVPLTVTLDANAAGSIVLPFTDLAVLSSPFSYQIAWRYTGGPTPPSKAITLPHALGPTVDYDLLIDAGPLPVGTTTVLITPTGPAGTVGAALVATDPTTTNARAATDASVHDLVVGPSTTADALRAAYGALPKVAATVTASGALVVNKHNPVDATSAALTMTLPTGQPEGIQISVEKVDATANAVAVTGSVRGVGSSTISLVWQNEDLLLRADSAGSWWPVAGHKTKTSLDANYTASGRWFLDSFTGTDDQKMTAALAAWAASPNGGTIIFGARAHAMTLAWQPLAASFGAKFQQKPLRITGQGAGGDGTWVAFGGATVVNLTYNGTAPAKIDTRGSGVLEIDHIQFTDTSGATKPFIQTTNTTLKIHDCAFVGSALTPQTCNQDAIVLGGTDSLTGGGPTAPFQGYGTVIERNYFDAVRRNVYFRNFSNNTVVRANTTSARCGADATNIAPYELDSGASGSIANSHVQGCVIADNTIELTTGYSHAILLKNNARRNHIVGNGFWDPVVPGSGGRYLYDVGCDTSCLQNTLIMSGYSLTYGVDPNWLNGALINNVLIAPNGTNTPLPLSGGTISGQQTNFPALRLDNPASMTTDLFQVRQNGTKYLWLDQFGELFARLNLNSGSVQLGTDTAGGGTNAIFMRAGTGAPAMSGALGDIYIRKDGGTGTWLYRCTTAGSATTGAWTAVL